MEGDSEDAEYRVSTVSRSPLRCYWSSYQRYKSEDVVIKLITAHGVRHYLSSFVSLNTSHFEIYNLSCKQDIYIYIYIYIYIIYGVFSLCLSRHVWSK